MNKPILVMMVGLACSGKSYHAEKVSRELRAQIFSSDALREEMFGDINDQEHNTEVFAELHRRIKECLKSGNNAVYDACNISSKRRRGFLQELKNIYCDKRCFIVATPYEQCLINNRNRDRSVPEYVIERMYRSWNTPYWFEGWDYIGIEWWDGSEKSLSVAKWTIDNIGLNQDNPHHTLGLAEHCNRTGNNVNNVASKYGDYTLNYAGWIHDCGKPFTKTFKNSKGEATGIAHYYSHENVGAYDSLFFDYEDSAKPLDVSILINLHMRPYAWERDNNEKLHNKCKRLWGKRLYNDVIELHKADKAAH